MTEIYHQYLTSRYVHYSGGAKGKIRPKRKQIQIQASLVPLKAQFNVDYYAKRPYYHEVGKFFGTSLSETGLNEIL